MFSAVLLAGLAILALGGLGWFLLPWGPSARLDPARIAVHLLLGLGMTIILLVQGLPHAALPAFDILPIAGGLGWLLLAARIVVGGLRYEGRVTPLEIVALGSLSLLIVIATTRTEYPHGYDPVFHSILAEKIARSGRLATDWRPFAPVGVNYPQGLHALLALLARWLGRPVPIVFQASYAWAGALTLISFRLVAGRFLAGPRAPLAATSLHFFACQYGSFFSYAGWGGLPTLAAQAILHGVLLLAFADVRTRGDLARGGLLLAALPMLHHLSALVAATILGAIVLTSAVDRAGRARAGFLLGATGIAVVLAAPFLVGYARHASGIGLTHTLAYRDEPGFTTRLVAFSLGLPLLPAVVAGLATWSFRPGSIRFGGPMAAWIVALAVAFVGLDWGYRALAERWTGQSVTAFTPSRFLTGLAYPLAIVAGAAFAPIPAWRGRVARGMACALLIGLCAAGAWLHARPALLAPPIREATLAHLLWARDKLPPEAFVLYSIRNDDPAYTWRHYLAWHETWEDPLPASEPREDPRIRARRAAYDRLEVRENSLLGIYLWLQSRGQVAYFFSHRKNEPAVLPAYLVVTARRGPYSIIRVDRPDPPVGPRLAR